MLKINSLQSITLDFIRLFAAQLVVAGHLFSFLKIGNGMPYIQNTGVVLFFVLSGLIISYTVFYKSQIEYSFKSFFIERFSRIYTGLLPSLIFIFLLDSLMIYLNPLDYSFMDEFDIKTFIGNLLMLQDYNYIGHFFNQYIPVEYKITSFGSGKPLWTLAIEWWLYMLFGVLYFFYKKSFSWKYFPILLLLSIIPLWNLIHGRGHGLSIYWIFGLLITLFIFKKQQIPKLLALFSSILLFFSAIIYMLIVERVAYNLHYVFFLAGSLAFLLLYQQDSQKKYIGKFSKLIKYLASYSFTLYLIHYSVIIFVLSLNLEYNKLTLFLGSFVLSNILALLLASIGEMKYRKVALKIKNYWR